VGSRKSFAGAAAAIAEMEKAVLADAAPAVAGSPSLEWFDFDVQVRTVRDAQDDVRDA
jgi:hypothetical protein